MTPHEEVTQDMPTDVEAAAETSVPAETSLPADLGLFRVLRDDGTADPQHEPDLPPERIVELFEQMLMIRTLDERCLRLQRQGRRTGHTVIPADDQYGTEQPLVRRGGAYRQALEQGFQFQA